MSINQLFGGRQSRSVHAAYQASAEDIGVSITSLYNKLNALEPETSAALVRYAAEQAAPLIEQLGGTLAEPLPGFRVKLLDGNWIEASERRIKPLRSLGAGALPGKSLVVYEPRLGLPIDVFPCEDGHAQERPAALGVADGGSQRSVDRRSQLAPAGFSLACRAARPTSSFADTAI